MTDDDKILEKYGLTSKSHKITDKEFIQMFKEVVKKERKWIEDQRKMPYPFSVNPKFTHQHRDIMIESSEDMLETFEELVELHEKGY